MTTTLPPAVLIMAGGTGGHVFPALAAAECLRNKGVSVEWLGTDRGIESRLVPAANFPIHFIKVSGLRGKGPVAMVRSLLQMLGALRESICVLRRVQPVCVLGMGGYVSGPGGLAAWMSGRPLVIHEQNSVAGTTNSLLAKIAKKVLLGYPIGLGGDKSRYIGNPVRQDIACLPSPDLRFSGRSGKLRLLVLGGSLGAKPINDLLPQTLALINANDRPSVCHQTGKAHGEAVTAMYQQAGVEATVEPFIDDMAKAYAWADVVLCRAGALTIAELTAVGLASLLVPLPHAIDDHQTENARWLVANNAALLLPQAALTPAMLAELLITLTNDRTRLLAMAKAARALAKIDAAEQVASTCLEVACG